MSSAFLLIHLLNKSFRSTCSAPGSSVSAGDTRANKTQVPGTPWWSSGWDFSSQCRGVPVPSLVRALGRHMPHSQGTEAIMQQIHERLEKMVHNKKILKKKIVSCAQGPSDQGQADKILSTQCVRRKTRGWRKQQAPLMEGCGRGREDPG